MTVKAYPEISKRHGEVVCVAGVRTDEQPYQWVRLWPIKDFRDLPVTQAFRKYQFIDLDAPTSRRDPRPESRAPNLDSIVNGDFLPSDRDWAARRPFVEPLIGESMCAIQRQHAVDGTSLGAFRPAAVHDVEITENDPWSQEQRNALSQLSLLAADQAELEWVPYRFRYRYTCGDPDCNGHRQMIIDWEIKQAYRRWSRQYPRDWQARIRHKWLDEMCAADRDTAFFVGNQFGAPLAFLVLGVWWPPKRPAQQLELLQGNHD